MSNPTTRAGRGQELQRYLGALWPDDVPAGSCLVFSGKGTHSLVCRSIADAVGRFQAWEAAPVGAKDYTGAWVGLAAIDVERLAARRNESEGGPYLRGNSSEITALPTLWLEIDLESPSKPKGCPRAALAAALDELRAAGLAPSMQVESGPSGVHLYWLLDEPLDFTGDARAVSLAEHSDVHAYLFRVISGMLCEHAGRPIEVDRVIDAVRVLRPAGSFNRKALYGDPFPVSIVELDGTRYSTSSIKDALLALDVSVVDMFGSWAYGRYSDHRLLPKQQRQHRDYSTEPLPDTVPPYLALLQREAPHLGLRLRERDGKPFILHLGVPCPVCSSPSSPSRAGESRINVVSGGYRCHHASCRANAGISFRKWVRETAFGVSAEAQLRILDMRENGPRPHRKLVPHGSPKVTREEVGLEIMKSLAESHLGKVGIVSIPTGAGKTRALAIISTRVSDIALLFKDYSRVNEFLEARDKYIASEGITEAPTIVLREGAKRACKYSKNIEKLGAERNVRSEVCRECDLKPICAAHAKAVRGEVIVGVHASHVSLRKDEAFVGRVVVFDEVPEEFSRDEFRMADVSHSRTNSNKAKRGEDANAIFLVSFQLMAVFDALTAQWRVAGSPEHGMYVSPEKLREVMVGVMDRELVVRALTHLEAARRRRTINDAPDPMFHPLNLATLKHPKRGQSVPHNRGIERLWDALLVAISEPREGTDSDLLAEEVWRHGSLSAMVTGGDAVLEVRRGNELTVTSEDGALDRGVVILSATGALHEQQIRAMNRACDVQVVGIDTGGAAPHMRIHAIGSTVSRKALATGGALRRARGGRPEAWKRVLGGVRAALALVEARHGAGIAGGLRTRVGVLTYKVVREGLDAGSEGWSAAQEACGVRVLVMGHYGKENTGSNEFLRQDVRLLVTLGDPDDNLGGVRADAGFLGMDPKELAALRQTDALAQAEGRLRAGWDRDGELTLTVHVHVGRAAPEHWAASGFETVLPSQYEAKEAPEMPGEPLSWDSGPVLEALGKLHRGSIRDISPLTLCAVSGDKLSHQSSATRMAGERLLASTGRVKHPVRIKLGRGPGSCYAPPDWSREEVEEWAAERLSELRAEQARILEARG